MIQKVTARKSVREKSGYRANSGTSLVLQLLKRSKGKIVSGSDIDQMLSQHGKGTNFHAIQRLVLDGLAKRVAPGRYVYNGKEEPSESPGNRKKVSQANARNRSGNR